MSLLAATPGTVYKDLGANHHMWTSGELWDSNLVTATTRTASFTWFGGFTGGVAIAVLDANNIVLALTHQEAFGVNGTAFGGSDRTDGWSHQFDAALQLAGRAVTLQPIQLWAPTWRWAGPLIEIGVTLAPLFF
jgi:hypothetical protein